MHRRAKAIQVRIPAHSLGRFDRRDTILSRSDLDGTALPSRRTLKGHPRTLGQAGLPSLVSSAVGRQVLVGRVEFVPSRLGVVAAFTPGEVVGEIFDMELHPGSIGGE